MDVDGQNVVEDAEDEDAIALQLVDYSVREMI